MDFTCWVEASSPQRQKTWQTLSTQYVINCSVDRRAQASLRGPRPQRPFPTKAAACCGLNSWKWNQGWGESCSQGWKEWRRTQLPLTSMCKRQLLMLQPRGGMSKVDGGFWGELLFRTFKTVAHPSLEPPFWLKNFLLFSGIMGLLYLLSFLLSDHSLLLCCPLVPHALWIGHCPCIHFPLLSLSLSKLIPPAGLTPGSSLSHLSWI